MRTHHHSDGRHSLTVCALDAKPGFETGGCPMDCGLNFVSRLESADISFGRHLGPLSIKCAYGGEEFYETDERRQVVDDSSFLILNDGQRYSSLIERPHSMESFCIWFRPWFADEVQAGIQGAADSKLDEPFAPGSGTFGFFERTHSHDGLVSPSIDRIRRAMKGGLLTNVLLEEMFHDLMERMLELNSGVRAEIQRVPALRASTREELYRRLHRAKDYLDASFTSPVSLGELATVAELSTHYFLRLFKQVFDETPREYQSRRRMERARSLLLTSDAPITQICYDVGYESLGSFSWEFRRRFGSPPSELRRHLRNNPKKAS